MSMRAVERFIKEQMSGDTKKALAILEDAVGKKAKSSAKPKGAGKNEVYSERIWYQYIWHQVNKKGLSVEDALDSVLVANAYMKKQNPDRNVTVNRANYYRWIKNNEDLLKEDDSIIVKNLETVFSYMKSCAIKGEEI